MSTTSDPFILALHKIPESIRVELSEEEHFILPVIPAQLAFESFSSSSENASQVLSKVVDWIKDQYQKTITISQAWDLLPAVRHAFELHKKKLEDTLTSLSGSPASTPSPSPDTSPPAL